MKDTIKKLVRILEDGARQISEYDFVTGGFSPRIQVFQICVAGGYTGLCAILRNLTARGLLEEVEYHLILGKIQELPNIEKYQSYKWPPGELAPRLEWLKSML